MAMILPTRKRAHSAPTAQPEPENTLAFKTGYWAGLELGEPSHLIDECCLRDQLDYRAGFNCGQREVARALEDYKILQARERAAMLDRWGPCRIGRVVFEDVDGRPL